MKAWLRSSNGFLYCVAALFLLSGTAVFGFGTQEANEMSAIETQLRGHLGVIASDAFEGRETGSAGIAKAEEYIARSFRESGLSPLPGTDGFFLPFRLYRFEPDPEKTYVRIEGLQRTFTAGSDFLPLPFSGTGRVSGEVVFAGYGITAPEYGYDDYDGLDVNGKIVLVFRHEPNEKDEGSPFKGTTLTDHALFARKARNAEQHGAKALLLVTDPLNHQEPEDLRLRQILSLDEAVPEAARNPDRERTSIVSGSFPALQISGELAELVFSHAGFVMKEVQRELDSGRKPSSWPSEKMPSAEAAYGNLEKRDILEARNVAAFLPGRDPVLRNEWIVVSAHHDHLGTFPGTSDTIYNGADDDASGVSAVLTLARVFAGMKAGTKRSIAFITFSGEEAGLLGSRNLIRSGLVSGAEGRTVFMFNLDMIGRNPEKPVDVFGDGFTPGLRELIESANAGPGIPLTFHGRDYEPASDHDSFHRQGIPFLFFFTGLHEDYHGLNDEADRIAYGRMAGIVLLARNVILKLADADRIGREISPDVAVLADRRSLTVP